MQRQIDDTVKQILQPIDPSVIDKIKYIHPSCYISYSTQYPNAGLGLFAKEQITKGTFLGNYVGRIHDASHKGPYAFHVRVLDGTDYKEWSVDGENVHESNFTRFINCALSDEHENVMVITCQNEGALKGKLMFYAKENICKDAELAFDYGIEYKKVLRKLTDLKKWQ